MEIGGKTCIKKITKEDVRRRHLQRAKKWLIDNGEYIKFELIESRFQNKNFKEIEEMKSIKKDIIRSVASEDLQARIGLGAYIETIANNSNRSNNNLQDIGNNKIKEKQKIHKNCTEEVNNDEY